MPRAASAICLVLPALVGTAPAARADEVTICYNYGCYDRAQVSYSERQLDTLHQRLAAAPDAAAERDAISAVIGRMYAIAGEQTPVWRDKGEDYADGGVNGQMDCVDHATTTDAFLRLLQTHGWLRFHEVLRPRKRMRLIFEEHWAASIRDRESQQVFVVDSWYFDNGHPAPVFTLKDWLAGKRPDGA